MVPLWLEVLLGEKFFNSCLVHADEKKNEENTFCLDCCISLCPHCLPSHPLDHSYLKIKRYVYQDVLGLEDAEKLIDCSSVQPYTTNRSKVVFLNQRPLPKQAKDSGNMCIVCERSLQPPFLFCSIACKVKHRYKREDCRGENHFSSPKPKLEHIQISQDLMMATSSDVISSTSGKGGIFSCSATSEIVKKKRTPVIISQTRQPSTCLPAGEITAPVSRRKNAPLRSPMY